MVAYFESPHNQEKSISNSPWRLVYKWRQDLEGKKGSERKGGYEGGGGEVKAKLTISSGKRKCYVKISEWTPHKLWQSYVSNNLFLFNSN